MNEWVNEWLKSCSVFASCCCRDGDDTKLPALAQDQRVSLLRLQQQWQQEGRVWQVHRVFHRQHLPPWVQPSDRLTTVSFYSLPSLSLLLLSISVLHAQRAHPLFCSFILSFLSLSLLLSLSPSHQIYPIAMLCIVIPLCIVEKPTSHTAPQRVNVCVAKSCSRTLWQEESSFFIRPSYTTALINNSPQTHSLSHTHTHANAPTSS